MSSTSPTAGPSITTIVNSIASIITLGSIGYAIYFDHQRHHDSKFRSSLKKRSKKPKEVYDSVYASSSTMSSWRPPGPQGNPHAGSGYSGRNKKPSKGGANAVQRSSAAGIEGESLFTTYEHLSGLTRGDAALTMLRKIASVVKPIMRKHGWRVQVLAEFLPPEQNLLGLNINQGYKICIRLRYHNNPDLFMPFEQCVDTMLHELCHNVWRDHDSNFYNLWEELRDEHEVLVRKGYTGEGFLGSGNRLGGGYAGRQQLPGHELRRLARESAEKRKQQGTLGAGSGQRLGGAPIHRGQDVRSVIADQVIRRNNNMDRGGCASGRQDAGQLSQQSSDQTFKTKAEEDDANNRAIAQALFELMEQEEEQKLDGTFQISKPGGKGGLEWSKENGLYDAGQASSSRGPTVGHPSEEDQLKWAMEESIRGSSEVPTDEPEPPKTTNGEPSWQGPITPDSQRTMIPTDLERTVTLTPSPEASKVTPSPNRPSSSQPNTPVKDTTARKRPASALSPSPAKPVLQHQSLTAEEQAKPTSIDLASSPVEPAQPSELPVEQWTCEICTCINPLQFLACDACGVERPKALLVKEKPKTRAPSRTSSSTLGKPVPSRDLNVRPLPTMTAAERFPVKAPATAGWKCSFCGSCMEHKWWTCSACGTLKNTS